MNAPGPVDPQADQAADALAVDAPVAADLPVESVEPGGRRLRLVADLGRPFSWALLATFGVLTGITVGNAALALSTIWVYLGVALFLAMALDPMVAWFESHRMSRGLSIAVVFAVFSVAFAILLALLLPTAIDQISGFARAVPGYLQGVEEADWFVRLLAWTGTEATVGSLFDQATSFLSNPSNLLAIGGGALSVGSGIMTGLAGAMFVLILTLYFLASFRGMKKALYRFAPAYARDKVAEITEHVTASVGSYISGMFVLALANAVIAFVLLSLLGVSFAPLLAVLALFVTMIPMIGSVTFWVIASSVALLQSWWIGLVFAAVYFAYMQIEAYVLTPRVMSRQIQIPGSLVIISALVGGTLLGLLGALIAVPVTASVLMVLEKLFLPRQDIKTSAPAGSPFA